MRLIDRNETIRRAQIPRPVFDPTRDTCWPYWTLLRDFVLEHPDIEHLRNPWSSFCKNMEVVRAALNANFLFLS